MGDGLGCTYAFNIDEFCQNFKHFPIRVDSALKILTRAGYLEYTDEQDNASRLMFTLRRDELYRIQENNPDTENLIRIILRSYTGLFSDYAYINEETLALRSGLSRQQVYETLVLLTKRHICIIFREENTYIIYTRERQESERIVTEPRKFTRTGKPVYEQRIKPCWNMPMLKTNAGPHTFTVFWREKRTQLRIVRCLSGETLLGTETWRI